MASLVGVLASSSGIKLVAFILATSTSTVINFFGQKFWVFELKKSK
jgi:putative flippase GtrA